MKTAKDKEKAFLKDFSELLAKYNAEFEVDSESDGMYSSVVNPYAEMRSIG
jgi:hypothetical protein